MKNWNVFVKRALWLIAKISTCLIWFLWIGMSRLRSGGSLSFHAFFGSFYTVFIRLYDALETLKNTPQWVPSSWLHIWMKKLNSIWRNLNLPVYKNEFLVFARFELLYKSLISFNIFPVQDSYGIYVFNLRLKRCCSHKITLFVQKKQFCCSELVFCRNLIF